MMPGSIFAHRQRTLVLLQRRITSLTSSTREPLNRKDLRSVVTLACARMRLSCRPNTVLEDLTWRQQMSLALRTRGLIGVHSSGLMTQALWLPRDGVVLDFMPRGCWLCAALAFTRPNCSTDGRLIWILSTTKSAPVAHITQNILASVDESVSFFKCTGHRGDLYTEFKR